MRCSELRAFLFSYRVGCGPTGSVTGCAARHEARHSPRLRLAPACSQPRPRPGVAELGVVRRLRASPVKPATKAILSICVLLGIAPVAFIGWYRWDFAQNRGFEFGYFGDFNRVGHALTRIPGVTITHDWANHDVTLEEFGYDITTSGGRSLHLNFGESDPLRDMSDQQLINGLTARIQQETQSKQ